jgi:hypothetical protein
MNRAYLLVTSILIFLIAAGVFYLGFNYLTADSTEQRIFQDNLFALLPSFFLILIGAAFIVWIAALISVLVNPRLTSILWVVIGVPVSFALAYVTVTILILGLGVTVIGNDGTPPSDYQKFVDALPIPCFLMVLVAGIAFSIYRAVAVFRVAPPAQLKEWRGSIKFGSKPRKS